MNTVTVDSILTSAGFAKGDGFLGVSYTLSLGNGWDVTAYCSYGANPLLRDSYAKIDIHLHDVVGTSHICHSEEALRNNLGKILTILRANSSTPDILKCPKCKTRYVSPKIPTAGERWSPFLSCKGMMTTRKGDVIFDGVSRDLPAVVNYR